MKAPTSNALERQLELARAAYTPPPELRERVLEKLAPAPASPGTPAAAVPRRAPSAAFRARAMGSAWAALRAKGPKALVGLGLVALGFAAGWRANALRVEPPPLPSQPRIVAPEPLAPFEPIVTREPTAAPEPLAAPAAHEAGALPASNGHARRNLGVPAAAVVAVAAQGARSARASETAEARSVDGQTREELALLQRAERAVRAGNAALGLALIAELETEHPRSKLIEERRAIELMAHCRVAATDGALRAERFLREHPRSIYAARIRELCHPSAAPSR